MESAAKYDYVIVGSGAAGAIIANRVSSGGASVCLLEAGPPDTHPYLHIPAGFIKVIFNPRYAWQFSSEPSEMTNGRRIPIPQGRTLGGSTSINGLVYNRGQRSDYDHWAELGNEGWAFADVLPYFKSMERHEGGSDDYRGRAGELPITNCDWTHPLCDAFIEGASELGLPRTVDYNAAEQDGVGYFQRSIHKGLRMSTARTFLRPIRNRRNLTIQTHARATRILFDGKRAIGVEVADPRDPGRRRTVLANREVVISCGALNTPRLLQLSGLGPASLLQQHGIPVVHELPGVGEGLSDHYSVRVVAQVKGVKTLNEMARGLGLGAEIAKWLLRKPSIMALSPSVVHWFWRSRPEMTSADLQGVFTPASYKQGYVGRLDAFPGMTAGVWQHRPLSRGYVRIRSGDAFEDPEIQPNYLEHPDDRDALIRGVRLARQLLRTQALQPYFQKESLPGDLCESDDELLDFARSYGVSSYHVNGSARMGPAGDRMAVVDSKLRVHGIENLRVADSSVMPSIPSANVCAATMMIGNRAGEFILGSG